nr:anaerobic ribonucleoside-triphosphate reductase activating protein [Maliibacterium massiliense]
MCETLRVAGIVDDAITDGPGLRLSVFVQGCPHHCTGCHNPQTWPFAGGQEMVVADILARLRKNPLLSGLTLSGGEPFCQPAPLARLARAAKEEGYEVACYTGYTFEQLLGMRGAHVRALLEAVDVLVDGPFVQARRNIDLRFRGSDNQRILNVPASLARGAAVLEQSPRWRGE